MKKITYYCDICGKELKGWNPKSSILYQLPAVDDDGNSNVAQNQLLCDECVKKIDAYICALMDGEVD